MINLFRVVALIAVLVSPTLADGADGDVSGRIDAYLSSVTPFGFSGAVLVEQDGEVILKEGYGMADRSTGLPITTTTRFDIGSLGKQFTAALIMKLVEADVLDLDAPLPTLLPDVPEDKASITPRHLLSHASGLPYHAVIGHSVRGQALDALVPIYLAQPLQFAPGERFSYSNPGYTLLAAIAERAAEKPFPTLLHERIITPAGLAATGHLVRADQIGEPWARAYMDATDVGAPPEWSANPEGYGAGSVVSTLDDLYQWMQQLREGRVLTPASVNMMWEKQIPIGATAGYGFGWFVATTPRETDVVFHAGDYQGFNAEIRLYHDERRLIILLSNVRLGGIGVREVVMHNVATMAAGGEATIGPTIRAEQMTADDPRLGTYTTESGGQLVVSAIDGGVRVASTDASVIAWMSTGDRPAVAPWADRVAAMLEAAAGGNFEPIRDARHRAVVVRGGPTELESIIGTDEFSWQVIGSRHNGPVGGGQTFARIRTGDRPRVISFTWMDDALLTIDEVEAAQLDLRRTGPDAFAWYDLFTGKAAELRLVDQGAELSGGTTISARRL